MDWWQDDVARIGADHAAGATQIVAQAAVLVEAALGRGVGPEELGALARALLLAQPAMAPLARLASVVVRAAEQGGPDRAWRALQRFRSREEAAARWMVDVAAERVLPGVHVLTISHSSAVRGALLAARARGVPFSVTCLESRPRREGVALARDLARAGVPVTLVVDAAGGLAVGDCDAVLLGADTLAPAGLVHKVGTWPLCLAAGELGVPVYALATPAKLLPGLVRGALEQDRDPTEVLPTVEPGLNVRNRAFDLTPLELLDGVFVGREVLTPEQVARRSRRVVLHPLLRTEVVGEP